MSGTSVLIQLLGGVALLLFGLHLVKQGVIKAYGGKMRRLLGRSLSNRFNAFFVGMGVTCLLQSSTATALLASSFATHGVATASGLALLLGADVGTTIVAQVLTLDLSWLQPIVMLAGVGVFTRAKKEKTKHAASIAIGLGLMLLALSLILQASEPMRESPLIQSLLGSLSGEPVLAVLVGVSIAFLAHSSLATVLLIDALSSSGVIALDVGFGLILGANLGAALPAVVNTSRAEPSVRRAPMGNLLFRLMGVLICLPMINQLADHAFFASTDIARQLVNFHLLFNIGLALLFLPWVKTSGKMMERWLPNKESPDVDNKPRYLDRNAFKTPSVALSNSVREVLRMGDLLRTMLDTTFDALSTRNGAKLQSVKRSDDLVDEFHDKISLYLTELSRQDIPKKYRRRCYRIYAYTTNLEHAGDILECSLTDVVSKIITNNVVLPDYELKAIDALRKYINSNMELACSVLLTGDIKNARALLEQKSVVKDIERRAALAHQEGLRDQTGLPAEGSSLYLDLLRDLNRINSHFSSIAYPLLEQAGELRSNRLKAMPADTKEPTLSVNADRSSL
ncbi:sodium-dependent phosphate transporter [Enterovibrio norvegicus]|uniref:Na/Pi cotransporter family protein n=1 Tax=Enterovibrio norvegicus TaxID=188144 RepID=UPI000C840A67|nr:Na/Pi cotransporter family protein [Enterovibrio norvegicus]MCC4797683.1 Na/Pi cotransporter family protein [Enterovibrio norvegicus]PMI34542.1 sodium-dependent phosphate transporter [Enterovibrio norvegicus]PMN45603.1 sodium-dependent phosphate transporter [Enterovibrio norvegicus]TKF31223.1 Na/Pi cotransporter family protein [Enterovibrio norvegicus]